ncbi:MAG: glycosyltransferase family 39 protein [Anaerolineae bacterium]|nr:glycosyltransferase family 39 protein [Anaerolineae bacterium]
MRQHPSRYWMMRGVALLLLLVLYAQLLSAATQLSATVDEGFHITSGYEYLRTGKLRLFDEHAPVAKALFAWPLFFVPDLPPPETADGYASGDLIAVTQATVLAYRPLDRVIVAPRLAAVLLTFILAATLYHCATSFAGPAAGLLALFLCAFDPNFLAHGSLATTDMGATAFSFWAIWAGVRWLEYPTRRRWCVAAVLLGLAQGAKLTALLLYPVLGLGVLLAVLAKPRLRPNSRSKGWFEWFLAFAGMVALSLLVLWALYGFELRALPDVFGGVVPLPAASHIERWLRLQDNLAYGREAFLSGQNAMHGWWQYFPVAFLVKTPLPLLLLFCTVLLHSGYCILKYRSGVSPLTFHVSRITFYVFPLLYALASLASSLNIGYRPLLPILPFLYVGIARCGWRVANGEWRMANGESRTSPNPLLLTPYSLLLVWMAVGTLRVAPHDLTFFNELAGGPKNGWRFLADSNTDWGQTFRALAEYQRENDLGPVNLSAFTFYDPAAYGVEYTPIAPMTDAPPVLPRRFNPEPGIYAISATTLDGVPLPYPSTFDWFRHREPFAQIGNAMFLYAVEANEGSWVAQCLLPVAPLAGQVIPEGFGINTLRLIYYDCEQSWVFPGNGKSAGWYVRATSEIEQLRWSVGNRHLAWWPTWVSLLPMLALRLSYVQPMPGELPAFAIGEWEGASITPPLAVQDVVLEETLTFLGYAVPDTIRAGTTVDVLTYWRVLAQPVRPLSLMMHLINGQGETIVVGDGLGVQIDQWDADDIIIQRHRLSIPEGIPLGDYQLQTGAYWLDTMVQWSPTRGGESQALLMRIKVTR